MSKTTGKAGLKLIKFYEGCRLTAYKPVASEKYYTIGWGHYGADVTKGETWTQAKANSVLKSDLKKFEKYVNSSAYVPFTAELTQNMFDALVSFCYNCGPGALKAVCKDGMYKTCDKIKNYVHDGKGNTLPGLVKRRQKEIELFNKARLSFTGTTYQLLKERTVYSDASTSSKKVGYNGLTSGQKKKDLDKDGRLDEGVKVVNKGTVHICGSIFMKVLSGYILVYSRKTDTKFVKKVN